MFSYDLPYDFTRVPGPGSLGEQSKSSNRRRRAAASGGDAMSKEESSGAKKKPGSFPLLKNN